MYCTKAHISNIVHTHSVAHNQVQCATCINKMKPGKSHWIDGMLSDNLKKGTPTLNNYLFILAFYRDPCLWHSTGRSVININTVL